MEVIGADGVHVGTVDKVEGSRIKLTKKDSGEGSHKGHHRYIDRGLVAGVEGDKVRLSAIGAVAVTMEEEKKYLDFFKEYMNWENCCFELSPFFKVKIYEIVNRTFG